MRNAPPELPAGVVATLASIHPDTFTQGAVWRLYHEAPIALAPVVYQALHAAITTGVAQAVDW